jgi:hypothetical protein
VIVAIEDLKPNDTPDYMLPAWIGCISWAISEPEVVAAFRQETGNQWTPGRSPLERMIDQSTGVDRNFIEAFIRWVNVTIWGPVELPQSVAAVDPVGELAKRDPSTRA